MKYKLFERGFVFDFETQSLRNYKSGEFANVEVGHYLYGEDGSCFSYERDLDPLLRRCFFERSGIFRKRRYEDLPSTWLVGRDSVDFVYYVSGGRRGFCSRSDASMFDIDTKWCYLYEYYRHSRRWYEVYEVYDEDLRRELTKEDISKKLRSIGWMNK